MGALESGDLALIRMWIVGDAEHYVRTENDFPAWLAELNRLIGVLEDLRRSAASPTSMAQMAATARDALRVIADTTYFKEQEGRVRSFAAATSRLTAEDKQILANMLQQSLTSPSA